MPRFFCGCGFGSSRETSSSLSGSPFSLASSFWVPGTCKGRWKELLLRGGGRKVRESSEMRGFCSGRMTGDLAEISYAQSAMVAIAHLQEESYE